MQHEGASCAQEQQTKRAMESPCEEPTGSDALLPCFKVGDLVDYWSGSYKQWMPGVVQRVHDGGAAFDLDIKKGAQVHNIRQVCSSVVKADVADNCTCAIVCDESSSRSGVNFRGTLGTRVVGQIDRLYSLQVGAEGCNSAAGETPPAGGSSWRRKRSPSRDETDPLRTARGNRPISDLNASGPADKLGGSPVRDRGPYRITRHLHPFSVAEGGVDSSRLADPEIHHLTWPEGVIPRGAERNHKQSEAGANTPDIADPLWGLPIGAVELKLEHCEAGIGTPDLAEPFVHQLTWSGLLPGGLTPRDEEEFEQRASLTPASKPSRIARAVSAAAQAGPWELFASHDMMSKAGAETMQKLLGTTKRLMRGFEGTLVQSVGQMAGCLHAWRCEVHLQRSLRLYEGALASYQEEHARNKDEWTLQLRESERMFDAALRAHVERLVKSRELARHQISFFVRAWANDGAQKLLRESFRSWRRLQKSARVRAALCSWPEMKITGAARECLRSWCHLMINRRVMRTRDEECEHIRGSYEMRLQEDRHIHQKEIRARLDALVACQRNAQRRIHEATSKREKADQKTLLIKALLLWKRYGELRSLRSRMLRSIGMQLMRSADGGIRDQLHISFITWKSEVIATLAAKQEESLRKQSDNWRSLLADMDKRHKVLEGMFLFEKERHRTRAKTSVEVTLKIHEVKHTMGLLKGILWQWAKVASEIHRIARSRRIAQNAIECSMQCNAHALARASLLKWSGLAKFGRQAKAAELHALEQNRRWEAYLARARLLQLQAVKARLAYFAECSETSAVHSSLLKWRNWAQAEVAQRAHLAKDLQISRLESRILDFERQRCDSFQQIDNITKTLHKELQSKQELAKELRTAYEKLWKSSITPTTIATIETNAGSSASSERTVDIPSPRHGLF